MKVCSECRRCFDDDVEQCSERHGHLSDSRPENISMIDGYRLEEHLYSGLRGDRFRATRMDCGLSCLVRVIRTDPATGQLFLEDARRIADLFHPNLTAVYESGTAASGELFVVSEDAAGTTLRDSLEADGPPDLLRSVRIVRTVAETLHDLHQAGVVFRSLSPDNILISDEDQIRLQNIDLGGADQHAIISNKFLIDTETTAIKYLAPEQCSGEPATPRTDVYSLGILLYELIAGAPPFDGARASEVIEQHRHSRPPELTVDNFDLRMLISHTLMESLSKRADLRQASADLFARQLRHIEQLATHVSTPPPAVQIAEPPVAKQPPRVVTLVEADIDLPDLQYGSNVIGSTCMSALDPVDTVQVAEPESSLKKIDPDRIKPIDFRAVREQMHDLMAEAPAPVGRKAAAEPKLIRWEEPLDDIPSVEETLEHLRADGAEGAFDQDLDHGTSTYNDLVLEPDSDEPLQGRNSQQNEPGAVIELGMADAHPTTADAQVEHLARVAENRNSESLFSSIEGLSAVRFSQLRRGVGVGAAVCVMALAFAYRSDIVGAFTTFDLDKTDPSGLRVTVASAPATVQKQAQPVMAGVEEVVSEPEPSSVEPPIPITHSFPRVETSAAPAARRATRRDTKPAVSKGLHQGATPKEVPAPITPSTIVITYADPKTRDTKERDPFAKPKNAAGMTRPRIVADPKP